MTVEPDWESRLDAMFHLGVTGCLFVFFGGFVVLVISFKYFPSTRQIAFDSIRASDFDRLLSVVDEIDVDETQMGSNVRDNLTMLSVAVAESSPQIVSLLLENGSDPNHQGAWRDLTPLHRTITYRKDDRVEIIELLMSHGADPTIKDVAGQTPIDYARNIPEALAALQWNESRIAE